MTTMNISNKRHDPFLVPEGYFDALPARILALTDVQEETVKAPRRRRGLTLYLRYAAGVAAVVAFFAVMTDGYSSEKEVRPYAGSQPSLLAQTERDEMYDFLMLSPQSIYDYETNME